MFIVGECPRCAAANQTLDVLAHTRIQNIRVRSPVYISRLEFLTECRSCGYGSVYSVAAKFQNGYNQENLPGELEELLRQDRNVKDWGFEILSHIPLTSPEAAPSAIPNELEPFYNEASGCIANGYVHAACVMFRKLVDLATLREPLIDLIPEADRESFRANNSLKWRLRQIVNHQPVYERLIRTAEYIKVLGDKGAHIEELLTESDAKDAKAFADLFIQNVYFEAARAAEIEARHSDRLGSR
ncbi:putative nucleic-acid-binding Zn-ribbon protein [Rhodobium orientis]|uniref:Uncharacterized protein n=1 Tax=Rhodobium orientis TaxID=34017 RepID=A0A327JVU1_9HYPH|nr:DUF4145 domain-containing protein [Rhodobium orientis]MBB4302328.1 putative nucleic-acid-binding Zn-ribbon protein [Rhodobium orientis]MBK5949034.1 hypothetical protein [Rhodobium orientis]RAI29042.1 hypothetical protein CH339_04905 [Rhodobium orientis]